MAAISKHVGIGIVCAIILIIIIAFVIINNINNNGNNGNNSNNLNKKIIVKKTLKPEKILIESENVNQNSKSHIYTVPHSQVIQSAQSDHVHHKHLH